LVLSFQVSKGDFTYWRCSKRSTKVNCPATVSQKGDTFKTNARKHIHQADNGALKRVLVTKEIFNEKSLVFCVFFFFE
jgi:hypothetical protein